MTSLFPGIPLELTPSPGQVELIGKDSLLLIRERNSLLSSVGLKEEQPFLDMVNRIRAWFTLGTYIMLEDRLTIMMFDVTQLSW